MPAYHWIHLYKDPSEMSLEQIVRETIGGLLDAGCEYHHARTMHIEDPSLRKDHQRPIRADVTISLEEATQYAIRDIISWCSTEKRTKWLPGITLIFTSDFRFDESLLEEMSEATQQEARQVKLCFWSERKDDPFVRKSILIDVDTWDEYVLMYGDKATHAHNYQQILNLIAEVCQKICPHFGWADYEIDSNDDSSELLAKGEWPLGNDVVVIGPQLADRLVQHQERVASRLFKRLDNGVIILKRQPGDQEVYFA